jgi:uncharacterized membrane protein
MQLQTIPALEWVALLWFMTCWFGYAAFANYMGKHRGTLLAATTEYRLRWMRQMLKRDNRMVDSSLLGNLLRSISFFASTTIFILAGLFTMLKYHDEASSIITSIPYATYSPPLLWEVKIFLLVIIFVYAFFKYTWSLRQYDYTCIVVGAAPLATELDGNSEKYAIKAARLMVNAARHFGLGLRGYYFGIAALAWFINAYAFMIASTWVVMVIYRREFRSLVIQYLADADNNSQPSA